MTARHAPARTYTAHRWCDGCHRTVLTTVELLTDRPASGQDRHRWEAAARREAEAEFHRTHAETCGRSAK